ncbi:Nramp family divalent metal transporter [Geomesophilobacter sediminis]|uniref:Divalent metal cation transporter MntH n=1 Tax=Geomesophilobacter sediminis TaxID=2798584 RepID=A0A8J7LYK6_9BACT|nr:Nramp family divalent metal transporter [Geomesophilobacter sediminis]MBJ6724972.1 Nramp family divalent metal transporter [Geomesophilobacter sediminis]
MTKRKDENKAGSDAKTIANALNILGSKKKSNVISRLLPFMGPAFIASVAYVDPGNFATNIQGGAQFGYLLIWVIVASNLMAMLLQTLAAKLGLVTGMNLAEHCREQFSKPVSLAMWLLMEIVAMSTDLAEFLGAALGFQLLFGIPLLLGAVLTGIATMLILGLERFGFRRLEAVISSMVGLIALCYLLETFIVRPDFMMVMRHTFVPRLAGAESVVLASGILGATVMPHAIFLHSALMQGRIVVRDKARLRSLYRFEIVDVAVAMGVASCVNAAMLIMAAATFYSTGHTAVATIEEAYRTLQPLLGSAARWIFGLSLLLSGLSSSTVGTGAGQVIMQGFIQKHIPIWLRRLLTMAPSLLVIGYGLDPTRTLVLSQVVLSFGLPFAVIPLVIFTSRRDIMGELVNLRITTVAASLTAALIVALNLYLIFKTLSG